jgi:hypothetical protein
MGLFDGGGLGSVIGGAISGIFGGREPAPQPTPIVLPQYPTQTGAKETDAFGKFLEYLPPILASIPRYEPPTQQEIILKLPEETKESGQMENGPQVYQGAAGALVPFAQQALGQIGRTIFGGGVGGAVATGVGGALIGQGVQQMMAGDACGCGPKPFVRLDKCGRPIITRAMQAKAKDMVMCMGIEGAAAALGVSVPLLAEIAFKRFKPRAKGISGAQLKTAQRVNNKIMHMAKKLEASCKRPAARRR